MKTNQNAWKHCLKNCCHTYVGDTPAKYCEKLIKIQDSTLRLFHSSYCTLKKWKLTIVDDAYSYGYSRKMMQIQNKRLSLISKG